MSFAHAETKTANLNTEKTRNSASELKTNSIEVKSAFGQFLGLQKAVGNQAFQRLVQSGFLQAKLNISQSSDAYEEEADKVAAQVVRGKESEVTPAQQGTPFQRGSLRLSPQLFSTETKGSNEASVSETRITQNLKSQVSAQTGNGQPLPPVIKNSLEQQFGYDFNQVRIHIDSNAAQAANMLNAQAFTKGSDIFFKSGSYNPTALPAKRLLAHELTHTIHQGASKPKSFKPNVRVSSLTAGKTDFVQRKENDQKSTESDKTGETKESVAPGTIELKGSGKLSPPSPTAKWLDTQEKGTGLVNVRFGKLAAGAVTISKKNETYQMKKQPLRIEAYSLFPAISGIPSDLKPSLLVQAENSEITGEIGLGSSRKGNKLASFLKEKPELIGLRGFDINKNFSIVNKLEAGELKVGFAQVPINLGGAFSGIFGLKANDVGVTEFNGKIDITIKSVASAKMELQRSKEGLITGNVKADVQMPKNVKGSIDVTWDGNVVTGEGKIGYSGEKLSGEMTVKAMDEGQAKQLESAKAAPAREVGKTAAEKPVGETKGKKAKYVIFGEGDLKFAFTDWLNGTAHVIIDSEGQVAIIGEIRPQKEFELFPQKDYNKKLFKLEARAPYGVPVVGNIYVFANVGLDAFAKLGPAKFYNIAVKGTYSTDPKKSKDFSVQGSLNISAAAGIRLRGEGGAGLQILAHDIKAGGGINATAEIQGYAEATPLIGYREKPAAKGEDKKGEFFIRGDLEIAAQPFLGLSGDLFVEVDAPWWSPCPDKKWTWPLAEKKWPIGSNFGINAAVDYVFGSGQAPAIEFKKVNFSAEKFLTDMYSGKTEGGTGKSEDKGKWAEKNSKEAEPPAKTKGKGDAQVGKAPELPPAKSKIKTDGAKKAKGEVDPNAKTADGKSVKQLQKEASRKDKSERAQKAKSTEKEAKKKEKTPAEKEELAHGLVALEAVTARYAKDGASQEEIKTGIKSVRRKFKVFKTIDIVDGGETWDYHYVACEGKQTGPKKDKKSPKEPKKEGEETWADVGKEAGLESGKKGKAPKIPVQQILAEAKEVDTAESIAGNYRVKFKKLYPNFPGGKEWQVHHSIPQKFRQTLKSAGINVNSAGFLRGVKTTKGEEKNYHSKITTYWEDWHRSFKKRGQEPNVIDILQKAGDADWKFELLYWEAKRVFIEIEQLLASWRDKFLKLEGREPSSKERSEKGKEIHQMVTKEPKHEDKPKLGEAPKHHGVSLNLKPQFFVNLVTLSNGDYIIRLKGARGSKDIERYFLVSSKKFDTKGFYDTFEKHQKREFEDASIDQLLKIYKQASIKK